jgi:ergothioneine biosynthesis protein EgtB
MAAEQGGLAPPELTERFRSTRALTQQLAAPLSPEDRTVQSMPDASPTTWHLAHTTWFFETFVLEPYAPAYERFDERFGYLYNSYYEGVGARHPRPERGQVTRPGVAEIDAYRAHVDAWLGDLLECRVPARIGELVELGLHHEQQHQELLLMDIHHLLSHPSVLGTYGRPPWSGAGAGQLGWRCHPGGIGEIGADQEGFSFDNEGPRHRVLVEPFEVASRLVTNADFAEFIADGGYESPELWMSDGIATARALAWRSPMGWVEGSGGFREHRLEGLVPLDPDGAVTHVSWFEADAYARWAGYRLPSEAEWELLAPEPDGEDAAGFYGTVWQWTASAYAAYPGFRPGPGAIGEYNGKFMVNQMVLRGSSLATPPGHARPSYRNFFPASARWAFSGIRLARDPA